MEMGLQLLKRDCTQKRKYSLQVEHQGQTMSYRHEGVAGLLPSKGWSPSISFDACCGTKLTISRTSSSPLEAQSVRTFPSSAELPILRFSFQQLGNQFCSHDYLRMW